MKTSSRIVRYGPWLLFLVSSAILSQVFFRDVFATLSEHHYFNLNDERLKNYLFDSDSKIYGRLVRTREAGALSEGGLELRYTPEGNIASNRIWAVQYVAFVEEFVPSSQVALYQSSINFQSLLFASIDRLPIEPRTKLACMYLLWSTALALVLSAFIVFVYKEIGWGAALLSFVFLCFSFWLVIGGDRLHMAYWSQFAPVVGVLWLLRRAPSFHRFFLAVYGLLLLKFLFSSFEFVSTVMIMAVAPVFFFAIRDGWKLRKALNTFLGACVASLLAAGTALVILSSQIWAARGSWKAAFDHIFLQSMVRRTHGEAEAFREEVNTARPREFGEMMDFYLNMQVYKFPGGLLMDMEILLKSFGIIFIVALLVFYFDKASRVSLRSFAAWGVLSVLAGIASMSWYVIFFQHSWVHLHINTVVWQLGLLLPLIPYIGLLLQVIGQSVWRVVDRRFSKEPTGEAV